jgi:hypothetical protein
MSRQDDHSDGPGKKKWTYELENYSGLESPNIHIVNCMKILNVNL